MQNIQTKMDTECTTKLLQANLAHCLVLRRSIIITNNEKLDKNIKLNKLNVSLKKKNCIVLSIQDWW